MAGSDKSGKHGSGKHDEYGENDRYESNRGETEPTQNDPSDNPNDNPNDRPNESGPHHQEPSAFSKASAEIDSLMERAEATMTLATAWSENFTQLVQLEFQRTLGAGKRILILMLFLFFLAVALVVSLCAGLGLLGYYYFQSIYIGFGIFLLSQIFIVCSFLLSLKRTRKLLGFDESRKQAKEALNDVTALFKQTD